MIDTRSVPPDNPGGVISVDLLFLHDSVAGRGHTVDTHVCRSLSVADGDGESSKVRPDNLDGLIAGTGDLQALPLALVSSFVSGSIWTNSCNYKYYTSDL